MRHTKKYVRDELRLPPQRRFVITMPFTPIEEQHYQTLYQQMAEDCGLDAQGAPLADDFDPHDPQIIDKMRTWLIRLRQSALHPEVGGLNRRALGHKDGPLRTVAEVLETMIDQTDLAIRTDQRSLLLSKLKRGQMLENGPRVKEALDIWTDVLKEAEIIVAESREQLRSELQATTAEGISSNTDLLSSDDSDYSDENINRRPNPK